MVAGAREPTGIPGFQHRPHRAAAQFRERLQDRGLVADSADGYHLTEAGRAHYVAHRSTYAQRWPKVHAPELDGAPEAAAASSARAAGPAAEPTTVHSPTTAARTAADDRQVLTEMPGEVLTEQGASAVPAASERPQTAPAAAPVSELYLARLYGEDFLLLAEGARAGWVHAAPGGWQIHDRDGRLVTTLPADDAHGRDVLLAARHAAAALGIPGAEHAAVTVGPLHDDRGRTVDTSPAGLASWSLLKGRVPGRTDVIVRSRCVGAAGHRARGPHTPQAARSPAARAADQSLHGGAAGGRRVRGQPAAAA
ncbi:hypothetical protein ACQEVF_43240 [Nonomuraea polychroma]|uniref:hypothetical protein n=1 Tax=Nonomuraea polychroma TaxID=46176 RepID=UPI003D8C6EF8